MRTISRSLAVARYALLIAVGAPTLAQPVVTPTLEHCAAIGAERDRLACYDTLAGRATAPTVPAAEQLPWPDDSAAPEAPSLLEQTGAPLASKSGAKPVTSLLSKFWEVEPSDNRGTFNVVGYLPNYVLPIHYTSRINRAPQSPTQEAVATPDYRREEAKFQLSLRTKLAQDFGLPGADVWAAFTIQAMWQIYNQTDSAPFRNTDYQPELMYLVPTPKAVANLPFGWQWSYTLLGLAHQSNGQPDPLSRSWNRLYLGTGFTRGNWSFTARVNQRLRESPDDDNNPDLMNYRGRAELQLGWASGLQTATLQYRDSLSSGGKGAAQLEWTYPIFRDQPNGLRWFVQLFSGYGETLTDYNFRQSSIGAGVSFMQF